MIDHRKLGRELELFDSDPLAGAGLPFWLPAGAAARHAVEEYLRDLERRNGYQHVVSPPLGRPELFRLSRHLEHFADDMFPAVAFDDDDQLMLRPSLCPHHALVYRARGRSHRELPLRIAEIGQMFRAERSGVLGGLSRVRSIWLNDAHVFCAVDQVGDEVAAMLALIARAHAALGLPKASFRLSLRGDSGKYVGADDAWDLAERLLREALDDAGVPYEEAPGEAAFYGPKIDIQLADPAGREFSISTIQIDFHQPAQFELSYHDPFGARAVPVMVHRSLVGSMERLFAMLLEAHEGVFPVWYSPVQLSVLPVGEAQAGAASAVVQAAIEAGLRAEAVHDGSIGARIRGALQRKIPYVGVVGPREAPAGLVALRLRDGRQLPAMPYGEMLDLIEAVVAEKSLELVPAAE